MKIENIDQVIKERHSVRRYSDRPIEKEKVDILREEISDINEQTGLFFDMFTEEPEAFKANSPSYGSFQGCRNYFVLYGKKNDDERIGYYGEKMVLLAQSLGLNTCWVALTFEKKAVKEPPEGMRLFEVIALGYGQTQGLQHVSKPASKNSNIDENSPEWFKKGMEYAMLAPTAINQQRFRIEYEGDDKVSAKALFGPCSKTDLGIVKLHFELGAGKDNFTWI